MIYSLFINSVILLYKSDLWRKNILVCTLRQQKTLWETWGIIIMSDCKSHKNNTLQLTTYTIFHCKYWLCLPVLKNVHIIWIYIHARYYIQTLQRLKQLPSNMGYLSLQHSTFLRRRVWLIVKILCLIVQEIYLF